MTVKSVFSRGVRSKRMKTAIIASLFLVAVGVCGLWVLSRETTLIYAANALSQRLDGRLQTVDLRGSLLGTITVAELHYQDRFGKLAIKDAHLEWRPIRLLIGQVAVGAMTANTGRLRRNNVDATTMSNARFWKRAPGRRAGRRRWNKGMPATSSTGAPCGTPLSSKKRGTTWISAGTRSLARRIVTSS